MIGTPEVSGFIFQKPFKFNGNGYPRTDSNFQYIYLAVE